MRDALRDAITSGKAITDDKVKSMKDVGMVLGAIRAGKLKPDDPRIPDSVKHVIDDMKKKGIDPTKADQKTIQEYLKDNPTKLDEIRKSNAKDIAAKEGQTTAKIAADSQAGDKKLATAKVKPGAKQKTGGLEL
jgi:hypothetical protein